jgi:Domain of unknown function (DUF397)
VHDGLAGAFTLLDFAATQSIGHVGYPDGSVYVPDSCGRGLPLSKDPTTGRRARRGRVPGGDRGPPSGDGLNGARMSTHEWRKSSYSGNKEHCVEVASTEHAVLVRDTKDRGAGPVIAFCGTQWTTFLTGIRHGELDLR